MKKALEGSSSSAVARRRRAAETRVAVPRWVSLEVMNRSSEKTPPGILILVFTVGSAWTYRV